MKRIFYIIFIVLLLAATSSVGQSIAAGKTSSMGIALIKHYEGYRSLAYRCPANVLTIGHGHTKNVYPGMVITRDEAERFLRDDLLRFENYVERTIERIILWYEFDAMVSFSFNVGYKINEELKTAIDQGNTKMVVMKIRRHNKARVNGRLIVLSGLVLRRKAECALYENKLLQPVLRGML